MLASFATRQLADVLATVTVNRPFTLAITLATCTFAAFYSLMWTPQYLIVEHFLSDLVHIRWLTAGFK